MSFQGFWFVWVRLPLEWSRRIFLQTPLLLKLLNPTPIICFIVVWRTSSQDPIVGLDFYHDKDLIGECNLLIFLLQINSYNWDAQFPHFFWYYQLISFMQGDSGHCGELARELNGSSTINIRPLNILQCFPQQNHQDYSSLLCVDVKFI